MIYYEVRREDNGPQNPTTGLVSRHRTEQAARDAIRRANRSLHRQAGYANAWHPLCIVAPDGERTPVR